MSMSDATNTPDDALQISPPTQAHVSSERPKEVAGMGVGGTRVVGSEAEYAAAFPDPQEAPTPATSASVPYLPQGGATRTRSSQEPQAQSPHVYVYPPTSPGCVILPPSISIPFHQAASPHGYGGIFPASPGTIQWTTTPTVHDLTPASTQAGSQQAVMWSSNVIASSPSSVFFANSPGVPGGLHGMWS